MHFLQRRVDQIEINRDRLHFAIARDPAGFLSVAEILKMSIFSLYGQDVDTVGQFFELRACVELGGLQNNLNNFI